MIKQGEIERMYIEIKRASAQNEIKPDFTLINKGSCLFQ